MLALTKRNIAAGDFTFGERIAMGRIFDTSKEMTDIERTKQVIYCLHDKTIDDREAEQWHEYALEVCEAYVGWVNRENQECSVPPQEEAIRAGIEQCAKECGDMACVVDMAERFGYSFEQVYKMPYIDVFTIWKVDAARARFRRRLDDVLARKRRAK